ncbi:AraC family transcriptional regulator [Nonomuraea longispora]|uniref:AraC family transcriptional regulator n=1 Tax=Nonomuraea longispora TaxID=1848320 RepID=A0A4R4N613_9ACTN|nr:AraC family transcriptional regulator [Nonomuraea longispora]TDC04238.1 AraC family transcriptional regulator [Nonomuraea longispora]
MSVRYWREPLWGGVDLMRARFTGDRFARHSHDTYAIGVVEEGLEEIAFPDGPRYTGAGEVVMIDPGVVHTGRARTPEGWTYRVLYPRPDQLAAIADEAGAGDEPPSFTTWSAADERACAMLLSAHRAAELGQRLAADSLLRVVMARLIGAYAARGPRRRPAAAGRGVAARARELLHESLADPPDLGRLAVAAGAAPFALLRSFRRAYGLPPHAYVVQLRVRRARELLERGTPPAEAAAAVGFCDQSHLSRHFRRMVGVTPGAYQRGVLAGRPARGRA